MSWWFIKYRSPPRAMHALVQSDPRTIVTPTGRRVYTDEDLLYYAELSDREYKLGLVKLIKLFKAGHRVGSKEFQQLLARAEAKP